MFSQIGAVLLSAVLTASMVTLDVAGAEEAEDVLSVRVSPKVSLDPGFVRVAIHHLPHEGDRGLQVEIDSPDLLQSSYIGLEGAKAAPAHSIEFKNLPQGTYVVRVWLDRGEDIGSPSERTTFRVAGTEDEHLPN